MLNNYKNNLIGYWESANNTENTQQIFIKFTDKGLLEWGFKYKQSIQVMPHNYWFEDGKIGTVCPPNPRKELTEYSVIGDFLTLIYSNKETLWKKAEEQDFFQNVNKKRCEFGSQYYRQFDYMSMLNEEPKDHHIKFAEYFKIDPQICVNTDALWMLWDYSEAEFVSFHFEDFKYILEKGVEVERDDNMSSTLLSYFAGSGYTDAVELMLDYGFEINAIDILEATALDYAIEKKRIDIVELLRNKGAKTGKEMKAK